MGGFLFNGCGVADKFKKVKSLGEHDCPHCGKYKEFHLCEVRRKIHVCYIPTFSIKNSYAVMCSHCDNGKFVSEVWAHTLLTGSGKPEVIFELPGAVYATLEPEEDTDSTGGSILTANSRNDACPACGAVHDAETKFCGKCGLQFAR
ncbi:MAG: zinc-ribbon domain-containing protein [Clostridia bacterium]|nr:zinc-ribbon domain-containing protein [Clostridia bacterium]